MKIVCKECCGSGKVESLSYREMAHSVQEPKSPVVRKMSLKDKVVAFLKRDWESTKQGWYGDSILIPFIVFVGIMCAAPIIIGINVVSKSNEDYARKFAEQQAGYIIGVYSADGNVSKCWVVKQPDALTITGQSITIPVYNVNSVNEAAAKIGITDASKCIRIND